MADISSNIAYKELKIAQIVRLNQLFQFLHSFICHGFCELSRMLMRKNVNNDVSKNSSTRKNLQHCSDRVGDIHDGGKASVFCVG